MNKDFDDSQAPFIIGIVIIISFIMMMTIFFIYNYPVLFAVTFAFYVMYTYRKINM